MRSRHVIHRNVELCDDTNRTEIDAVVITHHGVFIIEVKNTNRNIFIDDNGDYYRTGEYMRWDSNIREKLNTKHRLLQNALTEAGLVRIDIHEILVFTNNRIEVKNRCGGITTSFLGQLPYLIDEWGVENTIDTATMDRVADAVEKARCREKYPLELDAECLKRDYATVVAKLEAASRIEAKHSLVPSVESTTKQNRLTALFNRFFFNKSIQNAGTNKPTLPHFASAMAVIQNSI